MSINAVLVDPKNKHALQIDRVYEGFKSLDGHAETLVVATINEVNGTFKNTSRSTAGTTTITQPIEGGSVVITDLVLNTEKQTSGEVEVQFTDGSNVINIFHVFCSDAPANITLPINGRFRGWVNARIDLVVTGATDCSVTLGYIKIPNGLPFAEWDAHR